MRIVIEADTIQEFDDVIAHLAGKKQSAAALAVSAKTHEDVGSKADRDGEMKSATPKETSKQKETKSDVAEISYAKEVAPLIVKMAEEKGRDAVKALFGTFGVGKGPDLKADQYADVMKAINNALMA